MSPTCERILEALRRAPGRTLTTSQLARPDVGGVRFGGRLHELKQQGVVIERRRIRDGSWAYTLKSEPPTESSVRARDALAGAGEKTGSSVGAGLDGNEAVEVGADSPASPDPGGLQQRPFPPGEESQTTPLLPTSDAPGAGDGEVSGSGGELALFEVPPERLPHDQLDEAA